MVLPLIDPTAFFIFTIPIKWYGIAYAIGLLLGCYYAGRIIKNLPGKAEPKDIDNLLIWVAVGVIVGGRLGYVFFYNFEYFAIYRIEIITGIRKGGMSFHGGLIGTIISIYLYSKYKSLPFFQIMDSVAAAAPIGIFFGRIANFINAELWGRVTNLPWGIIFPNAGLEPRHPSQIYEAILEGALLFFILNFFANKRKLYKPGLLSGLFLVLYSIVRFISEIHREPDIHIGYLYGGITMGMLLSFPMLILGIYILKKINE